MQLRLAALPAAVLASLALAQPAPALISDVQPIDGPSADVLEVGGAAMSEDGTGGLVYLKRAGGRAHVFAAQYVDGAWARAQQVDRGQGFDSSWPRIGAGDGGRLVVTWVQEGGPGIDRLFSAALDPGSRSFEPPVLVDPNVGEATATFPSLAMARGGQAYLTYRVITSTGGGNPPGYVGADTRVARYSGELWSVFGSPADRNPSIPVRSPTAVNSPRVAVDIQGGAIIAFQEPGDDFVDRIWARRIFGSVYGNPLMVSPGTYGGAPLRGPADAFDLDVSGFGQGAVAFRQQPGQAGRLPGTRIFVNEIPDLFAETSGAFVGAQLVDGGPRGGPRAPQRGRHAPDRVRVSVLGGGLDAAGRRRRGVRQAAWSGSTPVETRSRPPRTWTSPRRARAWPPGASRPAAAGRWWCRSAARTACPSSRPSPRRAAVG